MRDLLQKYDAEVIRHFLVASHYRSPINYSEQSMGQSIAALKRLYGALQGLDVVGAKSLTNSRFEKAFHLAMEDDFNTAEAFGVLFDLVKEINKEKSQGSDLAGQLGALLIKLGSMLGLLQQDPEAFLKYDAEGGLDPAEVDALIVARKEARDSKDWAKADEIRDRLAELRVVVEDGVDGSSWRIEQ